MYRLKGFTLIELMIVIAIIGIIASVALPQYSQYTRRATFSEVKIAATPIKIAIIDCYQRNEGHSDCNSAGPLTVPGRVTSNMLLRAATPALVQSVALAEVAGSPEITVTPETADGIQSSHVFILTGVVDLSVPALGPRLSDWIESGAGCDQGWC